MIRIRWLISPALLVFKYFFFQVLPILQIFHRPRHAINHCFRLDGVIGRNSGMTSLWTVYIDEQQEDKRRIYHNSFDLTAIPFNGNRRLKGRNKRVSPESVLALNGTRFWVDPTMSKTRRTEHTMRAVLKKRINNALVDCNKDKMESNWSIPEAKPQTQPPSTVRLDSSLIFRRIDFNVAHMQTFHLRHRSNSNVMRLIITMTTLTPVIRHDSFQWDMKVEWIGLWCLRDMTTPTTWNWNWESALSFCLATFGSCSLAQERKKPHRKIDSSFYLLLSEVRGTRRVSSVPLTRWRTCRKVSLQWCLDERLSKRL